MERQSRGVPDCLTPILEIYEAVVHGLMQAQCLKVQ